MPEGPEVRIMSDFINHISKDNVYVKSFHVERGNICNPIDIDVEKFKLSSLTNGKELIVNIFDDKINIPVYVFMGMSGNWKYLPTSECEYVKHTRLRFDDINNMSLILYGGYMGPKYSINRKFGGVKRGPDPVQDFEMFKRNILNNINKPIFDKPIFEVLLNQEYFNSIGNYLRSTILYYLDVNPFQAAKNIILENPEILDLCRDIPIKSYEFGGGQLRDWKSPFNKDHSDFDEWVYYKKGFSCKDSNKRTFWFHPKWENKCINEVIKR